jgi:uncharacterized cupin superfamily protein
VNAFSAAVEGDASDPPGYRAHELRLGPLLEAEKLGATVYELGLGESICPYHYEHGNEEWLLVLAGRPLLRHPGGEELLDPGDLICFPEGPEGAHKLTNRAEETDRGLPRQRQARRLAPGQDVPRSRRGGLLVG